MTTDPLTLYKLMILYMLKQARFPMSYNQISAFLIGKGYTDAFTVQQALNDLQEAHLAQQEVIRHRSSYEITREGEEALVYFGQDISEGIITDIEEFLKENKVKLRSEVGCTADYVPNGTDFLVTCEIRDGKNILIRLELSAPTKDQAEIMCDNWESASQKIYASAMGELLKD